MVGRQRVNRAAAPTVDGLRTPTGRRPMPPYEAEAALRRSPEDAIAAAEATLAAVGFRITDRPRDGLLAESPGYTATRQNALLAAGRVELSAGGRTLRAAADMAGAAWMRRFLLWFPLGLGLFLSAVLSGTFFLLGARVKGFLPMAVGIPLLTVLPWAFIGPVMSRAVRRKAEAAVETLVSNAAG